jgi:3-oxoacyl-[acyl-carrier protein] reductase
MNVIVTGVSRGIGKEVLKLFANDPSVNKVIGISRSATSLQNDFLTQKGKVTLIDFDFLNNDLSPLFKQISSHITFLDILINNAGLLVNKPFQNIQTPDLNSVYQVNVLFPFQLIQKCLPLLEKSSTAHIVNISSMGGVQGSAKFSGLSAYSSSKAAIAGLTECLAEEFKSKNISVNALAIGAVQTEMLSEAFPDYRAPLSAIEMAEYIFKFAKEGHTYFNGKILQVSSSTP